MKLQSHSQQVHGYILLSNIFFVLVFIWIYLSVLILNVINKQDRLFYLFIIIISESLIICVNKKAARLIVRL